MKQIFKLLIIYALTFEAKCVLRKYRPRIIAVTGSVGKTSTKDAIFTAISGHVHARKSEKSFNSEIGVPLTILGLQNAWSNPFLWFKNLLDGLLLIVFKQEYPEWLVLEVGADRPGDIERVAEWLAPEIVVFTRLPDVPVHVEFFSSPEEVIKEKKFLAHALKAGGTLIVNADDEKMLDMQVKEGTLLSYGFNPHAQVRGKRDRVWYEKYVPCGMKMQIGYENTDVPYQLCGVLGRHHLYPVLAAFAVARTLGLDTQEVLQKLSEHSTPPGRMKILRGMHGSTIIDDTYNASPIAVAEALTALSLVQVKGKKIVGLGDMLELGQYAKAMHEEAGRHAATVADLLYTVGVRSRAAASAAVKAGMARDCVIALDDARKLGSILAQTVQEGDIVLIKGSQSIRMERAVAAILDDPSKKKELLVRQDVEWEGR